MGFLNPWLLPFALGVGLPVLIHLLNRYRIRETRWAAMEFLRRAARIRSRQIRLEDILLLVLRCLAVLLVMLALARPTLLSSGAPWALGERRAGALIAVDASYSMAHKPAVESRFDVAAAQARRIAGTLSPGDPVTLVRWAHRPQVLLNNAGYDPERFAKALAGLKPAAERLNLEAALGALPALAKELKAVRREVYLVSDVQATDWRDLSGEAQTALRELGAAARVFVVGAGGSTENAAITTFELASGLMRQGTLARYLVSVHNFGLRPRSNVRVVCRVNGTPVEEKVLERIEPGQTAAASLYVPLNDKGIARLSAELEPDELDTDNVRRAVADVRDRIAVLCVDGSPSPEPFGGAADFVAAALCSGQRNAGGLQAVKTIPWIVLPSERLAQYDIVVLANLAEVTQELAQTLGEFVQRGGGLIIFLGENVRPDLWNARLKLGPETLLPCRVGPVKGDAGASRQGASWDLQMPDHPLTRPLRALPLDVLGEVRFYSLLKADPERGARVVLSLTGGGDPVLVEREFGRGRVLLFTSSADRKWNNLVLNPAYPLLLHGAVTYLTRRPCERPFTAGEPLVGTGLEAPAGTPMTFTDPAAAPHTVAAESRNGEVVAELKETGLAGFYEFRTGAEAAPVLLAVNPETQTESDVRVLEESEFEQAAHGLAAYLPAASNVPARILEERNGRELWRLLLAGGLLALAAEALLARRLSRRKRPAGAQAGSAHEGPE